MNSIKTLATALWESVHASEPIATKSASEGSIDLHTTLQLMQLYEYIKLYRQYQKAYFAKIKRHEFAKDEQHFMMKYQEKIDLLLRAIQL